MKKLLLAMVIILMISSVYAIQCENTWMDNIPCNFTTPPLSCTTYDLINTTGSMVVDDGPLTQIAGPIYYAQFNATSSGKNIIVLCDNTSAVIDVQGYSLNTVNSNLSQIRANTVTALANQATMNQKLDDNFTKVINNLSSISGNLSTISSTINKLNLTNVNANITTILNRIGDPTFYNASSVMAYLYGNQTSPITGLAARIWHYAERYIMGIIT